MFGAAGVAADCALEQDASTQFGYAFDGFPMFGSREADGSAPVGLDACGGHVGMTAAGETYHYHATEDFPNLPACLVGVQAQENFTTTATAGVGATRAGQDGRTKPPRPQGGGDGMPPGFDAAAETLGVTPEALLRAMDDAGGPGADLAAVAAALGVDEAALRDAQPQPPGQ